MTFQLLQPTSLAEACALLAASPDDALPVAGGTDLLSEVRDGTASPATLVALDSIADAELAGITDTDDDGIRIGALTTIADVAAHENIRERYAALAQAAAGLATPQVRNLGTLGGNLNQRPRCWYYRHPLTVCLKRGGDRCYAVPGVGKYLCVTGGDRCFIVHPSDTAVALTALGASVTIASPDGQRTIPIADYFIGPDVDLMRENILRPGELCTAVNLPPRPEGRRSIYLKARERESGDFALVSVAAALTVVDDVVIDASVVLGGVAPTPYRAASTEQYLSDRPVADIIPADAGVSAIANPRPLPDNAYKIPMASNLTARAVAVLSTAE
jgi:xanthine dehydrogenase YagS FAD-binding subunit